MGAAFINALFSLGEDVRFVGLNVDHDDGPGEALVYLVGDGVSDLVGLVERFAGGLR